MNEYVFLVGDDYESNNKEYVSINSDKGKLISIALAASGIPFKGRFDKERIIIKPSGLAQIRKYSPSIVSFGKGKLRCILHSRLLNGFSLICA